MVSMRGIELKIRQTLYHLKHGFFAIENIALAVAIFFCLIWTYQSITSMTRNWELAERLRTEKKALELLELETATMELENAYYETTEYQELAARRLINKKLPGETLIYLPENSVAAKFKHQSVAEVSAEKSYSNFEKWLQFLFPSNS